MLMSADIGHNGTKIITYHNFETGDVFKSSVKPNNNLTRSTEITIVLDDKPLIVGSPKGNFSSEDDKSIDKIFHTCLLTGIARNMQQDKEIIQLVTGLPINYFKLYKDKLMEKYMEKNFEITLGKTLKKIKISDIKIYPESAGYHTISNIENDHLIIDIGGSTVDVSLFSDHKLIDGKSYDKGMNHLYGYIANRINKSYGTNYDPPEIEKSVNTNTIVYDNEVIPIDYTEYLVSHLESIISNIKNDFPWKKSIKSFIGGGALLFKRFLEPKFNVEPDANLMNAKAFYLLGVGDDEC